MFKIFNGNKVQLTEEELQIQNSEEAAIDLNEMKANNLRLLRDGLLSETDWWASSDLTMSTEQIAYRQALRDITTHDNWPNLTNDDWPTKP
jgi:hypothetical protein